jgi:hypothetical protein
MANTLQLKNDIKKLKTALASKGLSASIKNKLKGKLEKAQTDLKSTAPRKVSGAKSTIASLKELVKKKKYGVYKRSGVDLKKDAEEPALPIGRRVSKGIKGNQYGNKKSSKGNVYYEYRANRLDVKQPSKTAKYPKLAEGGEVGENGYVAFYKGKKMDVYAKTSLEARDKAAKAFGAKKAYDVTVMLAEKDGKQVTHNASFADGGETFDADYWEGYNEEGVGTMGMDTTRKLYVVDIKELVQGVIDDFNDDNEMGDVVTPKDFQHIYYLANKFYNKKGYISKSIVYTMLIQESRGEYKKGGMMAHGGKLSKKDFFKKYEENEDENMHTENVVLLAENYGTESDIRDAKTILAKHESIGHLPTTLRQERDVLHDKLYAKYVQSREDGGMMAKGGKLPTPDTLYALMELDKEMGYGSIFDGRVYTKKEAENLKNRYQDNLRDGMELKIFSVTELLSRKSLPAQSKARILDSYKTQKKNISYLAERFGDDYNWQQDYMEKGGYMAEGGITEKEVVDSNAQMVLSNVKEVKHHADELSKVVTKKSNIEAWVVAKIERASTDLSDVTHYLEGQHDKMSMGGSVYNHLHKMDKK